MVSYAMRQLEERHMATKVELMVWSNKMDLLALSNSKGEVTLHRLSWQKVWSLSPPLEDVLVRGIAWRPDGKVIAIGYDNNEVLLVDVENKDIIDKTCYGGENCKISSLNWQEERANLTGTNYNNAAQFNDENIVKEPQSYEIVSLRVKPAGPIKPEPLYHTSLNQSPKYIKKEAPLKRSPLSEIVIARENLEVEPDYIYSLRRSIKKEYLKTKLRSPEVVPTKKKSEGEIKSDDKPYEKRLPDSSSTYLPKLPPISRTFGTITEDANEILEDTKKIMDQSNLNFLLVCLTDGTLTVRVFGLFPCGILRLPDDIKNDSNIVATELSADLKNIFVLVIVKGFLKLVVFDTDVLSYYCREIHALAYKHGQLMSLMDYLENTMHAISEAYENMLLLEMESKLSQYAESMPEVSVSADFLELLMFGILSDPLEAFLLHDLTDKGIKKLGHSIELSHSNIQKLILKHLQAVGQNIAYHLSELRGMARLTEKFQALGIEEVSVAKSFNETGAFLVKASEVQIVIDDSMKKYKALFMWLYSVLLRVTEDRLPDLSLPEISQQETAFIADYLYNLEGSGSSGDKKKHCYLDRLGQYLADRDLVNPISHENNPWEKLIEDQACLKNNPSVIPRNEKTSLVQQYNALKSIIKLTFSNPQHAIGSKISISSITELAPVCDDLRVTLTHIVEEMKLLIAFIPQRDTTNFTYMEVFFQEGSVTHSSIYFKSPDVATGGLKTIDLQFYIPELLSVLLEQPGDDRCAIFIQMPVRAIRESGGNVDGATLLEPGALRNVDNMVACKLAVSGSRKVAVLLSENMHKVRTFEMEVEEDEEEEDMDNTRDSDSLHQSI